MAPTPIGTRNTEIAELRAALETALPLLRADAAATISSAAVLCNGAYDLSTLDARDAALVSDLLGAIREAERLVGRPQDGAPAWLDGIIDGEVSDARGQAR